MLLFCYEIYFILSLSDKYQADVVDTSNSTSRYLDDLLDINKLYFKQIISQIYPTELQLKKASYSETEAPLFGLEQVHSKWLSFI